MDIPEKVLVLFSYSSFWTFLATSYVKGLFNGVVIMVKSIVCRNVVDLRNDCANGQDK